MGRAWNPQPEHVQQLRSVLGTLEAGLGLLLVIAVVTMLVIVPAIVQGPILPVQSARYQVAPSLAGPPCDSKVCAFSPTSPESLLQRAHRQPVTSSIQPTAASGAPIMLTPSTRPNSGGIMRDWFEKKVETKARARFLQHMTELARNQGNPAHP